MILFLIIAKVICQDGPDSLDKDNIFVMQNRLERYYFNMPQKWANANYTVRNMTPINKSAQNKSLPIIKFLPPINTFDPQQMNNTMCPFTVFGPTGTQYSLFLSPFSLDVFYIYSVDGEMPNITNTHNYFFSNVTNDSTTKCTSIAPEKNQKNFISLDCSNVNGFLTILGSINYDVNHNINDITFSYEYYTFDSQNFTIYWTSCYKREADFIKTGNQWKKIFLCKFMYHLDTFNLTLNDSIIAIANNSTQVGNTTQYNLQLYSREQFIGCNKFSNRSQQFLIQDFLLHSSSIITQPNQWNLALLIQGRSGICKCTLDSTNQCDFLELQDSNYTRMKQLRASDTSLYFYVTSNQYVYKIYINDQYQSTNDVIKAYYAIRQPQRVAINVFPFLNFIIVQQQTIKVNDDIYINDYVKNCLLGLPSPQGEVTFKIFQRRINKDPYIKPYSIFTAQANSPCFAVNNVYKYGNLFIQWSENNNSISLSKMNHKSGDIEYSDEIEQSSYLQFSIALDVNYTNEDDIFNLTQRNSTTTTINLTIVPFNDPQLAIITLNKIQMLEFDTQTFQFDLDRYLIGPQQNYIETFWNVNSVRSQIQYIKNLRVINSDKVFFAQIFDIELSYQGAVPSLLINAAVQNEDYTYSIHLYKYNYKPQSQVFSYYGEASGNQNLDYGFEGPIEYFQKNILTGIVYANKQLYLFDAVFYSACCLVNGIPNSTYIFSYEYNSNSNIVLTIPQEANSIVWYIHDADCSSDDEQIEAQLMGQIDYRQIPELQNYTIISYQIDLFSNQTSIILLSDGTIVVLTNYQQLDYDEFQIEVSVKIKYDTPCIPQAYSKIFLLMYEDPIVVYVCQSETNPQIIEFIMPNPYQIFFSRQYSLYNYDLLPHKSAYVTDQKLVYIPAEDQKNQSQVILVYDPNEYSPNVLVQSIFVGASPPPLTESQIQQIECFSVTVSGQNDRLIYSMVFAKKNDTAYLNLIQPSPIYYGQIQSDDDWIEKMIIVSQQTTQNIICMPYNLSFDFSDSTIKFDDESWQVATDQVKVTNDYFEDLNITFDTTKIRIRGPIEDYEIKLDDDSLKYFAVKKDMAQLQKRLADHFEALKYGLVLDITHLDATQYRSLHAQGSAHNLIFVITSKYLLVLEKSYKCSSDPSYECTMRIAYSIPLSQINLPVSSSTTDDCQLSFNSYDQLIIYCFSKNGSSNQATYQLIVFTYSKDTSFNITQVKSLNMTLGNRVQIQTIVPILANKTVYQFIKFNYESSPSQSEILVGLIDETYSFKFISVLESSALDYRLIGDMIQDVAPLNDTYCTMVILEFNDIKVKDYAIGSFDKNEFNITKEQLNHSVFNDTNKKIIKFISILYNDVEEVRILIGTEDDYFQAKIFRSNQTIEFVYVFHKYFQCKQSLWEEPTIIDNEANMLIITCIGATKMPNIFFDIQNVTEESNLVYTQIFSKAYSNYSTEGWPRRVLESVTSKKKAQFRSIYFEVHQKQFLLMENDTYLAENYNLRDRLSFEIFVSPNNPQLESNSRLTGNLSLINDYKNVVVPILITYEPMGSPYKKLWIIILIVVLTLLFTLILLFVFYTLCAKTNINFKLNDGQVLRDTYVSPNATKAGIKTQEFTILDEAIKEVLAVNKQSRFYRLKKGSSDSMRMESKIGRQEQSSDSD